MLIRALFLALLVPSFAHAKFTQVYNYCDPSLEIQKGQPLQFLTYNIKSTLESSLTQIGDEIGRIPFDFLALQEVDRGKKRSDYADQTDVIARRFGLCGVFYASVDIPLLGGRYGISLLSRYKMASYDALHLPQPWVPVWPEPRSVIRLGFKTAQGARIHVFTSHMSLMEPDRIREVDFIRDRFKEYRQDASVLMGDLNAEPGSVTLRRFTAASSSPTLTFRELEPPQSKASLYTFPSSGPNRQLDHFLLNGSWEIQAVSTFQTRASDHLPLWMSAISP